MSRFIGNVSAYAYAVSQGYTGTEEEYAELMASYATVAEEAAESAESAQASATTASGAAQTATTKASEASVSAQTATTKASEASTSATQAGASATSASQSAQIATTKASEASASATQASTKASEASASATTASSKASEASASATSAQTAQGLAESARDDAVDAKTDAESARDLAQQYAESIDPEKIYSAYPTDTASGSVVSFADGADDIPMKSVKVAIEPVQDLHGQSNPYLAGGGKNKFDGYTANWKKWQLNSNVFKTRPDTDTGVTFTPNEDGTVTVVTAGTYMGIAVEIESSDADRVFSVSGATYVTLYSAYEDGASRLNVSPTYATIPAGVSGCIGIRFDAAGTYTIKCQLETGSTATDYAPYSNICPISGWTGAQVSHSGADRTNPTTYSITFPSEAGTVYGGTLDVTNGLLTVDRAGVDLGALTWTHIAPNDTHPYDYFRASVDGILYWIASDNASPYVISSSYRVVTSGQVAKEGYDKTLTHINNIIFIANSDYSDAAAFKTAMSGVQLCYELATPFTYTLTPTEIKSLLGDNNIWADAGDTTVTYRADTKLYIDKKISEVINALS